MPLDDGRAQPAPHNPAAQPHAQRERQPDPLTVAALATPIGRIALHWRGSRAAGALERVVLAAEAVDAPAPPPWLAAPFAAYFADPSHRIELPLRPSGTAFQRRVRQAIAAIPPGATRTYGELARALGSAARAVGGACRANPYPLIVPCHRVVARTGLGGFAGDRTGRLLDIKRRLLRHEGHAIGPGQ
jgi:methylated-DNA-[protein]-cysteine S-methyltransferase